MVEGSCHNHPRWPTIQFRPRSSPWWFISVFVCVTFNGFSPSIYPLHQLTSFGSHFPFTPSLWVCRTLQYWSMNVQIGSATSLHPRISDTQVLLSAIVLFWNKKLIVSITERPPSSMPARWVVILPFKTSNVQLTYILEVVHLSLCFPFFDVTCQVGACIGCEEREVWWWNVDEF